MLPCWRSRRRCFQVYYTFLIFYFSVFSICSSELPSNCILAPPLNRKSASPHFGLVKQQMIASQCSKSLCSPILFSQVNSITLFLPNTKKTPRWCSSELFSSLYVRSLQLTKPAPLTEIKWTVVTSVTARVTVKGNIDEKFDLICILLERWR
jgi:hypothetical protein